MGKRKSYAEEEMNLSDQSKAFVDYLTSRGVLSDQKISDKNIREKKKENAENSSALEYYIEQLIKDWHAEEARTKN